MIQVIILDEHETFRVGLRAILSTVNDMKIAAEATTLREALSLLAASHVDVLVTGLSSAGCAGMDLLRRRKQDHPDLIVLVVTSDPSAEYLRLAVKAGVTGYLTRECSPAQIISALRKVAGGGMHLAQHFADGLLSQLICGHEAVGHQMLSTREFDVFLRIANGQTCTKIAHELSRSVKTISSHKARIMEKMHLESTAQLVQYAVVHKLMAEYRR